MKLERYLVLNAWIARQLGATGIEELKRGYSGVQPGPDGESAYLRVLLERDGLRIDPPELAMYDERIRGFERRLADAGRTGFRWKYFQYLALLHVEIFLDALTTDPDALRAELDQTLVDLAKQRPHLGDLSPFSDEPLRRLAFFMATGSGKTLLLHANIWQLHHYLDRGAYPEALVERPDGRREFDNVLLITPNEGLSSQHIVELRSSGIDAVHLAYDEPSGWLFGPQVRVIEISKLRPGEDVSGDGVSIPLESLGSQNLVFVDEGHKGVGAEAQRWKERQKALSEHGVLVEYSATFAQSVAAAPRRSEKALLEEYGKSIVFDYSYRHFYDDGYGKNFEVLNLASDAADRAHELLVGGLLSFYQQVSLHETGRQDFHEFEIEPPLWVFLGAGVIRSARGDLSDVAQVLSFIRRFLEDPSWARETVARVIEGRSGFEDESGRDLFNGRLEHIAGEDPSVLYDDILERVFHGRGALEIWEIKRAEGEIGLRTGTATDGEPGYFGLVNVGDSGALRRYLERRAGFEVQPDEFTESLFPTIDTPGSPLNLLIGSRKFIEGWSSWRVSTMGLMNMGRSAGPQVIQLFGRGVRLKGRDRSLQRSTGRGLDESHLPEGLAQLETLSIFGWNADYIHAFQKMLDAEEVGWEIELPVRELASVPELYIPAPEESGGRSIEPWRLGADNVKLRVDLTSRLTTMREGQRVTGSAGEERLLDFSSPAVLGLVDISRLYLDLLLHKTTRGYAEMLVRPREIPSILEDCDVYVDEAVSRRPDRIQEAAWRALKTYADRAAARAERSAQAVNLQPTRLEVREKAARPYRVRGSDPELREQLLTLIADRDRLYSTGDTPIPRLHVEQHLFSPLLLDPRRYSVEISVSPAGLTPGEAKFLEDLRDFWESNHAQPPYLDAEVFVLRNLPHSGVGFFRRSGFYPDFILWLVRPSGTQLTFVEPHGMHHGGLAGNADKIDSLREIEKLSKRPEFRSLSLRVNGFILTETPRQQIRDAGDRSWKELEAEFHILSQSVDGYVSRILAGPDSADASAS